MVGLIFGANGQDGYYLNELLIKNGFKTIGVSRSGHWPHGNVSDLSKLSIW
jgi:GDPmannose 4,6-dehydratase